MEKVNLFIVGAGKSGTTALANQLSVLDEVFLPEMKEPHFFASYDDEKWAEVDHFGSTYIQDIDRYEDLYQSNQHEKYLVDASTSYLHRTGTAERIHEYNRDAKIIMLLRNPVDRAYSHYLMSRRVGHTRSDFLSAIENEYLEHDTGISYYIKIGMYANQVEEYFEFFPSRNIKIILYEDYTTDVVKTFKDLLSFLELSFSDQNLDFLSVKHNETRLPRYTFISSVASNKKLVGVVKRIFGTKLFNRLRNGLYTSKAVRKLSLQERQKSLSYFYEDIKKLETILETDLSAWYDLSTQ